MQQVHINLRSLGETKQLVDVISSVRLMIRFRKQISPDTFNVLGLDVQKGQSSVSVYPGKPLLTLLL